jgi:SAM-dependent methyltransferase
MTTRQLLGYYFLSSNRRRLLDKLLANHSSLYKGTVLDIGGRDRGIFKSPKDKVAQWIIADIEKSRNPDMVLDVCDMHTIKNESIDIINAIELFEHVKTPEKGIAECFRILRKEGIIIISMPFLYPIHADPFDFQRWTRAKWEYVLTQAGFDIQSITPMGGLFTVLTDMLKYLNASTGPLKYIGFLAYPAFDLIAIFDRFIGTHKSSYTTGYFIIARK